MIVFMIVSNVSIGSRLDRLEQATRLGPSGSDTSPEPFSWNPALQTAFGRLPLLGGQLDLGASGLYLVGVRNPGLQSTLAANCVHDALEADKGRVLFASSRLGQERLGRLLLSLQAEANWDSLDEAGQNEVLRRLEPQLRRYEDLLYVLADLDAEAAVGSWLEESREAPPRVVILDDPRGLDEADLYLERLRMLTEKSCVPFVLLVPSQDSGHFTRWQTVRAEAFTAILEAQSQDGRVTLREGTASLALDAASGRLTSTSRETVAR
ncbi:MAG: hypothetical protein FJX76_18655 [Armatimonadetes bacterium]|nr:hypothetical protein [Armatimonadota bacterium]